MDSQIIFPLYTFSDLNFWLFLAFPLQSPLRILLQKKKEVAVWVKDWKGQMPYTQIHWIKLERRLLNDYRFYTLSEQAQLFYIKMLLLAAETNNKIPKDTTILRTSFRSNQEPIEIENCIKQIKGNFPKFKETKHYYQFVGWKTKHNWYLQRNSNGTPREVPEQNRIDKNRLDILRKEYIKLKGWNEKDLLPDDYARIHRAIKTLLLKAKSDEKALKALNWVARQGYDDWTMETVIKKFQNTLIPICSKCKNKGKYTNTLGYTVICDCLKGQTLKLENNPRL